MRHSRHAALAALVILAVSSHALAQTRPAAPQVTVGADLKVLRFDWNPVPGAHFYRLWVKPGGTRYIAVGDRIPASVTQAEHIIPVHLTDWQRTRYVVTACNSAGCTHSAALNPQRLMLDTIGYFKASNTDPQDNFGREVALSNDGLTLAVSAEHESSNATGVNGNQADNSSADSGAVYIYRRTGTRWRQEAYLKPPVNRPGIRFGVTWPNFSERAIALSADGSIAAIGTPLQSLGINDFAGEVYVFQRTSTGWRRVASLRSPEPSFEDFFGTSVDISLDARTIKVSSLNPINDEGRPDGRTHIFTRSGATWAHQATLAPFYAGDFCPNVRMSRDGATLVGNCAGGAGARMVTLKRSGSSWVHAGDLRMTTFTDDQTLALNVDATAMALSEGSGVEAWVSVYRWEDSTWVRDARLVPPADDIDATPFGAGLALSADGTRLAVTDFLSSIEGAGVMPGPAPDFVPATLFQGAVYFYERNGPSTNPWRLKSLVKAPLPGEGDRFGISVALSGSGRTLAVGARAEDSNARGIDGDQTNESATDAGAAYLY